VQKYQMIRKTLHRKLNIERHEYYWNICVETCVQKE